MDSNDLTRDQGQQVWQETRGILDRVYALKVRMDERGFPPNDPVYAATVEAWTAIVEMNHQWHRIASPQSFGSLIKPEPPAPSAPTSA